MEFKILLAVVGFSFLLTGCSALTEEISAIDSLDTVRIEIETAIASTTTIVTTTIETTTTAATTTKHVDPPADLVLKGRDTVEACADMTLEEFVTDRNVELKDGSALLDTSNLGYFDVEIVYLYDGAEFTQTLQYQVVDTTKPLLINGGWNTDHKLGTDFDLSHYVGYGDNYDRNPVLTYEGTIDINAVGAYPLVATVTDSSGNSVSWNVTINVVEEVTRPVDTKPRVNYSDFMARYARDDVRFGIDVSSWQGDVDYRAVRDAGCSFVIIRAGSYYSQITPDDHFRQNLTNAASAGLDVGIYFYTTDRSEDAVREHVRWLTEQLDGQKLEMPIVFDWEEFATFQEYGMNIRDLNNVYAAFADEVIKQGYKPMLYSSKNFLDTVWSERTKSAAPVWLAHYVDETDYTGRYAIWQASAYGRIPGIDGDVDMDIQYLNESIG